MMNEDEIYRGLVAQGVPESLARRQARTTGAPAAGLASAGPRVTAPPRAPKPLEAAADEAEPPFAWPFRLDLPWSHLVSDDDHHGATIVTLEGGRQVAKIFNRQTYRDAKRKTAALALRKMDGAPPAPRAQPMGIRARVWVPDNRPGHDVANLTKATHDALEGIVFTNDEQLYDVHWSRAGVDVDAPRAEIVIYPLLSMDLL